MAAGQASTAQQATEQAQQVASGAAARGKEVVDTAGDQAQHVAGVALEQASRVTSEASAQAAKLLDDAKGHLLDQARSQTDQVNDVLQALARQLRAVTEGRPQDAGQLTDLARQAAEQVERVAEHIRRSGFDGVVSDVRRYARRRPALFLAGALTAGVAVGRIVRAGREPGSSTAATAGGSSTTPDQPSLARAPAADQPALHGRSPASPTMVGRSPASVDDPWPSMVPAPELPEHYEVDPYSGRPDREVPK